jgi:hypothetical protein
MTACATGLLLRKPDACQRFRAFGCGQFISAKAGAVLENYMGRNAYGRENGVGKVKGHPAGAIMIRGGYVWQKTLFQLLENPS